MNSNRQTVGTMTEQWHDIMLTVAEGNITMLQEIINAAILRNDETLKQTIGNKQDLLVIAIWSRKYEVVKLVMEYFDIDPWAVDGNGITPIVFACTAKSPFEIIVYLMEHSVQKDRSPLEYVVFQDDVDLAKALIAYALNRQAPLGLHFLVSLYVVTIQTGNLEMLQCLLDASNDVKHEFFATNKQGNTGLKQFALEASYEVEKKIAVFKTLFKEIQPEAYKSYPERYNVNEILTVALCSIDSTSLIPYFIQTELKWEKRTKVLSLYERLLPKYSLYALSVLCECGPVTGDRDELNRILRDNLNHTDLTWYSQLQEMFENAIEPGSEDEASPSEKMQLLEDFASFTKSKTLPYLGVLLRDSVSDTFSDVQIPCSALNRPSFHRAISCMMDICNDTADYISEFLLSLNRHTDAIAIFTLLRYCTRLPMRPNELVLDCEGDELLNWIMHLFGPWKTIQQRIDKPKIELFTLQRFARDVVRESLWQGVKGTENAEFVFRDRLQALDIPKELNEYLRYCDYTSTQYFLKHMGALMHFMEGANSDETLQYPFAL